MAALVAGGSQLVNRQEKRIEGGAEAQVTATLGATGIAMWLYSDSASFSGSNTDALFEEWSVRTPQELIQEVAAYAAGAALRHAKGAA